MFTATSFLSAFLLFLVQPLAAKLLLPMLGGSPAVWTTAMVFFQATLLGGYSFAHLTLSRMPIRRQVLLHATLLAAVLPTLPIALPVGWRAPAEGDPIPWTLAALLVMVGAPFLMLSTVGPTLQRWFSRTVHPRSRDPYFLYAAGNAGSLLALLSYPFVLEPSMSLSRQALVWTSLYGLLVAASAVCAVMLLRHRADVVHDADGAQSAFISGSIGRRRAARWVFLAFIPSALMLGVTRHLSTDIASVPLLWVVPLSLYLMTFIIAFGRDPQRVVRLSSRAFKLIAVPLALTFLGIVPSLWLQLPLQIGGFACAGLMAHGQLAAERAGPSQLTRFYLLLALGGVLGGIFAALVAPLVFTTVLEYPIAIVLALAARPPERRRRPRGPHAGPDRRGVILSLGAIGVAIAAVVIRSNGTERALTLSMIVAAAGLLAAFALARRPLGFAGAVGAVLLLSQLAPADETLFVDRTFFGVTRVSAASDGRHVLVSGTTVHGMEDIEDGDLDGTPTTYYTSAGPLGDVFASVARRPPLHIGAVGAGAGTVAAYLRSSDSLAFFEIDEAVVRIATDSSLFSFVAESRGRVEFVLGDGRVQLDRSSEDFDVLVVDAFTGDAIPTHLLTVEALRVYRDHMAEGGLVAFNVSNRYFDLTPVLARLAADAGLAGIVRDDPASTPERVREGALASTWVVLADGEPALGDLLRKDGWTALGDGAGAPLWSDDYTNLLGALR